MGRRRQAHENAENSRSRIHHAHALVRGAFVGQNHSKPKRAGAEEDTAGNASTNKVEITFGQAGSLLLVSDSIQAIEKVLSRQAGGLLPALEEQPAFQADFAARLRGAPFYAWINVKDSIDLLTKAPAADDDDGNAAWRSSPIPRWPPPG